jgi:hypothetical protein
MIFKHLNGKDGVGSATLSSHQERTIVRLVSGMHSQIYVSMFLEAAKKSSAKL